jgi:hypothetical protein
MSDRLRVKDISRQDLPVLSPIGPDDLITLPPPYDKAEDQPAWKEISEAAKERIVCNLDGVVAASLPHPEDEDEERRYVDQFVDGLRKLLTKENNWTFLQPLTLSLEYCVGC